MACYYTVLESRSHAFLLERRLKDEGIVCELTYMPRSIMIDLCNMGIKFGEGEFRKALNIIRHSGLPGCRLYKEVAYQMGSQYLEEKI